MLITVAPHRNRSTVLQDTVEDVRHRLSVVDTNTVTTVGFMSQQQDRLIGMDHNFSAQFADIQRRQEVQSEQLGSFNGQIAEVVPRVSERLVDQSLDTLQASLRQQLRDTLRTKSQASFLPSRKLCRQCYEKLSKLMPQANLTRQPPLRNSQESRASKALCTDGGEGPRPTLRSRPLRSRPPRPRPPATHVPRKSNTGDTFDHRTRVQVMLKNNGRHPW
jgi:hypothetical protein